MCTLDDVWKNSNISIEMEHPSPLKISLQIVALWHLGIRQLTIIWDFISWNGIASAKVYHPLAFVGYNDFYFISNSHETTFVVYIFLLHNYIITSRHLAFFVRKAKMICKPAMIPYARYLLASDWVSVNRTPTENRLPIVNPIYWRPVAAPRLVTLT